MIKEYQAGPDYLSPCDPTVGPKWNGKVSVDLAWVASASPAGFEAHQWTAITLCGSDHSQVLNVPYSEFMVDWMAARAGRGA